MTLTYGPSSFSDTGTFPVSIATPATCSLTSAPGNVVFNYVAFGAAVNASTTFGVTCTSYLPYTMTLDAASGTVLGVNYTLVLSASSATGIGSPQTFTISGNAVGGQPGTCGSGSCSA
jgi:spore coat protein U-like protein